MRKKPQIAASLPTYILEEVESRCELLEISKGEYMAAIAAKWYADGCPPVTPQEARLRTEKAPKTKAPKAS
jgi:hypothetical protein